MIAIFDGPNGAQPACQILPPGVAGYVRYCPYTIHPTSNGQYTGPDLAKARTLAAQSGTQGQTVTIWSGPKPGPQPFALDLYLRSVLRRLGYRVQLKRVPQKVFNTAYNTPRLKWQLFAFDFGDFADYPSASAFFLPLLTCATFHPTGNGNFSELCHPRSTPTCGERSRSRRPTRRQRRKPGRRSTTRSSIRRPGSPGRPLLGFELVSRRVGNYVGHPWSGDALLDQLWVH